MAIKTSSVDMDARRKLGIKPGDTVRVWQKIQEKGKTRLQAFEGIVLARKHGSEGGSTFTVRRVSGGVGVEKIFPLYSPVIDRIEIVRRAKVRRAKLYYIREKVAREIRRHMRNVVATGAMSTAEFETPEEEAATDQSEGNTADEGEEKTNEEGAPQEAPVDIPEETPEKAGKSETEDLIKDTQSS